MNEMARGHAHHHHSQHCHNRVHRQQQEDGPDNMNHTDKSRQHHQIQTQTRSSFSQIPIEDGEDVDDIIDESHVVPAAASGNVQQPHNNNNNCAHHVKVNVKNYTTEAETVNYANKPHNGNCPAGMSGISVTDEPPRAGQDHLSLATALILTYLVEIGIQIFLTFRCCPALVSLFTTVNPSTSSTSATSGQSDYAWTWFLFISMATTLTSVLVTTMSIIWVCLGLDFAGRLCGRLLCYVMHFLHLGLLWRYAKLAFAYDSADIQEFIALRIFQVFIQSLPLATIHLAWYITFQENWSGSTPWLILIESASIIIAIIISSHIKQAQAQESLSSCTENYMNPQLQHCKQPKKKFSNYGPENPAAAQKLTAIPRKLMFLVKCAKRGLGLTVRAVLICIRLAVVALLIAQLQIWICIVLLVSHFALVLLWTIFRARRDKCVKPSAYAADDEAVPDKLEYRNENRLRGLDLVRKVIEFSYILFWDVSFLHATRTSRISSKLTGTKNSMMATMTDGNLSLWAFPICLVLLENCMGLGYIWFHQTHLLKSAHAHAQFILLTMALILGLAVLYFVVVNFVYGKCTISKLCDVTRRNNVITVPALTPAPAANDHRHHHSVNTSTSDIISADQDQSLQSSGSGNKTVKNECGQSHSQRKSDTKTITVNETRSGDYGRNKIISQSNENEKLEDQISSNATLPLHAIHQHQRTDNDDDSYHFKCRSTEATATLEKSRKKNCPKNGSGSGNYIDIRSHSQIIMTGAGASSTGGRRKPKKIRSNHTDDYCAEQVSKNLTPKMVGHTSNYNRGSDSSPNLSQTEIRAYPSLISTPVLNIDSTPTNWVPDTCCNDSNGSSSNSRNTNTLLTEFGTGSGEKSVSLLEQDEDDENEIDQEDKRFVFYFPKHYSPLVAPHDHRVSPTAAVTPSRTRKLHVHSTNHNYKQREHRPASAAPPPRCRSSASNRYTRKSEGGKLTPVSNVSCVTMAMPFSGNATTGSLQRIRASTSTQVEIKKASRVIMNTNSSPYKNNSSNHVHRKAICSTVGESPCAADAAARAAVAGDLLSLSNLNKYGYGIGVAGPAGEKRASDGGGGRCTSVKTSAATRAAPATKRSRIDHVAKPKSLSRNYSSNSKGIVDPPDDYGSYDKLMEDSYGILICEGEETMNTTSAGNCIDSVSASACRNEKLQFHHHQHQPPAQHAKSTASPHQQGQHQHLLPSIFHVNKKLRVLCAKCLQNHDPLLTNCLLEEDEHGHGGHHGEANSGRLHYNYNNNELCLTNINNNNNANAGSGLRRLVHTSASRAPVPAPSETTEYPSGTEMTWTLHGEDGEEYDDDDEDHDHDDDQLSGGGDDVSSSHLSTATYTTWPKSSYHPSQVQRQCQRQQQQKMSMWTTSTMLPPSMNNGSGRFPKEFTSREYVRTWLLTSSQANQGIKGRQNQNHRTCENSDSHGHGNCRSCKSSNGNGHPAIAVNGSSLKRSQNVQLGPRSSKHTHASTKPNHSHSRALAASAPAPDCSYEILSTNPSPCLNQNQLMQSQRQKRAPANQEVQVRSLSPRPSAPSPSPVPVHGIDEPDNNINELSFNQSWSGHRHRRHADADAHAEDRDRALYVREVQIEETPKEVTLEVGAGKDLEIIV